MELPGRPALPGHGDHLGVGIDPDGVAPTLGQFGDRAATAAADVDHGPAGEIAEQCVGTCAQFHRHRLGIDGVEDIKKSGHARHNST